MIYSTRGGTNGDAIPRVVFDMLDASWLDLNAIRRILSATGSMSVQRSQVACKPGQSAAPSPKTLPLLEA